MSFFTHPVLSVNATAILHLLQNSKHQPTTSDIKNHFIISHYDLAYALLELHTAGFIKLDESKADLKYKLEKV